MVKNATSCGRADQGINYTSSGKKKSKISSATIMSGRQLKGEGHSSGYTDSEEDWEEINMPGDAKDQMFSKMNADGL